MRPKLNRRRFLKTSAVAGGGLLLGAGALNEASPYLWPEAAEFAENHSYWTQSARSAEPAPALVQDIDVDVAVVGGGFTGLSAAYYFARNRPGARVALLEARGCGNGASGRNGAMVLTLTEDRFLNFSADPAMDKKIYDLTAANRQVLAELSSAAGVDCELDCDGSLQVFNSQADLEAGRAYVMKARALGMPLELWDRAQVQAAVGTGVYPGGCYDPGGGHVHPMKLVQVLRTSAQRAGVAIYEDTPIAHIDEGPVCRLNTNRGRRVRAGAVVLGTNAFSSRLGFFRNQLLAVHEYVAITPALSEAQLAATGWSRRIPFNDSRTEVFYLGRTRDHRIHIGGGHARYRFNDDVGDAGDGPRHFAALERELVRLYPSLQGVGFAATWTGVVDWSLDASPSVGQTGRHGNIFYGIGYSGHGVNLTSVFGRIIADLICGQEPKWREFPFVNRKLLYIPNEPFRSLGAKLGMAWYELTS